MSFASIRVPSRLQKNVDTPEEPQKFQKKPVFAHIRGLFSRCVQSRNVDFCASESQCLSVSVVKFTPSQNVDSGPSHLNPSKKARNVAYCRITEKISETILAALPPFHQKVDCALPTPSPPLPPVTDPQALGPARLSLEKINFSVSPPLKQPPLQMNYLHRFSAETPKNTETLKLTQTNESGQTGLISRINSVYKLARTTAPRINMKHLARINLLLALVTGALITIDSAEKPIIPPGAQLELLYTRQVKLNSGLTEGPAVAPDGSIYFTDMPFGKDNGRIMRFDPKTKKTTAFTENAGKSNGLAFDDAGNLLSCDGADGGSRSVKRWDLKTGHSEVIAERYNGKRFNSPNDLCVDLKGRIYFTDPRYGGTEPRELPYEGVFRIEKDGKIIEITHEVEKPNGIAISPDQKILYIADHNNGGNRLSPSDPEPKRGAMKIYAFPLDSDGKISGPRKVLIDFGKENGSDGMRVDANGNLFVACRSLARPGILAMDPTGKELGFIATGAQHQTGLFEDWKGIPSNVEFGIGEESDRLYVTIDKSLYRIRLNTRGYHPHLASR
jgi:gluconolactonase